MPWWQVEVQKQNQMAVQHETRVLLYIWLELYDAAHSGFHSGTAHIHLIVLSGILALI